MNGHERVQTERIRQVDEEGWDADHDDHHRHQELYRAAACYRLAADGRYLDEPPPGWPWEPHWWKPAPERIRNLEKAGALLLAEQERLGRLIDEVARDIDKELARG